ncbi:MAG: trypsin-like peptidase domain-containing protein, partial [Bacteroidia bacterium]|nr:trypsin-like peptidase domain-containing protein [Bacteroidia bacterium]
MKFYHIAIYTLFIFTLVNFPIYSQSNIDGYKHVIIPDITYKNGVADKYKICSNARNLFRSIGFNVYKDVSEIPDNIINNSCLTLVCNLKSFSEKGQNTWAENGQIGVVEMELYNCQNILVAKSKGITEGGSSWDLVFEKSLDKAFKKATKGYNYQQELENKTIKPFFPEVEQTNETEETLYKYFENSKNLASIEGIYKSYKQTNMPHYKIGIKKYGDIYKAIIIESELRYWREGEVKAYFQVSSKDNFYSVKWLKGDKKEHETFCLQKEGILSIELTYENVKTIDTFIKLYPLSQTAIKNDDAIIVTGSGFLMNKTGLIATNAHVIESSDSILISIASDETINTYSAKMIGIDKKNDVALLQINDTKFIEFKDIPYTFDNNIDIGKNVFTIGYPLSSIMGNNYKVSNGIISSKTGVFDDPRYYQI